VAISEAAVRPQASAAFFTNIKASRGIAHACYHAAVGPRCIDAYRDIYRADRENEMVLPKQLSSLEYPQDGTIASGLQDANDAAMLEDRLRRCSAQWTEDATFTRDACA